MLRLRLPSFPLFVSFSLSLSLTTEEGSNYYAIREGPWPFETERKTWLCLLEYYILNYNLHIYICACIHIKKCMYNCVESMYNVKDPRLMGNELGKIKRREREFAHLHNQKL